MDIQLRSKYATDKLSFSSCSKVNAFLRTTSFGFSLKETLTLLRHYIANQKLIRSCYRMVPSAIWETFSEFLIFCNLFHEPLGE